MDFTYCISKVTFDDNYEATWQIVPLSWIHTHGDLTVCFWPPTHSHVERLIKTCAEPDLDVWLQYSCDIIRKFETYEKARQKLTRYKKGEDPDTTADENRGRGKRKKFHNQFLRDSENIENIPQVFLDMPKTPVWAKSLTNEVHTQIRSPMSNETNIPVRSCFSNIEREQHSKDRNEVHTQIRSPMNNETNIPVRSCFSNFESELHSTDRNGNRYLQSPPLFDSPNSLSNKSLTLPDMSQPISDYGYNEVIRVMRLQLDAQKTTNELLSKLIMTRPDFQSTSDTFYRNNFNAVFVLPAMTLKDIHKIEELLKSNSSKHLMIERLKQCGGRTLEDTTVIMLRTLLTDDCAELYNYEGRNSNKFPFKDLMLHDIIIDVALLKHSTGTELVVKQKIKNWLRLAKTRINNRKGGKYNRQ